MASKTPPPEAPQTPPEYATIDVQYSVTLKGRYEPDTDKEGKQRTNKKGETIMRPVKVPVAVTVPQLTHDEWAAYWTSCGLDPSDTFAHWINYLNKQKQESEKGTLRTIVTKIFNEIGADHTSNKALVEILSGREEIVTAIVDFQNAINDNLVGKPVSTERNQKAERLAVAEKVAEASPELFRKLAAMTPDEIKKFLEASAASND